MSVEQSKADSWIETIINVSVGFVISLGTQCLIIAPALGLQTNTFENVALVGIFTVTSIARQYTLRRAFNGRPVWATIKSKFS